MKKFPFFFLFLRSAISSHFNGSPRFPNTTMSSTNDTYTSLNSSRHSLHNSTVYPGIITPSIDPRVSRTPVDRAGECEHCETLSAGNLGPIPSLATQSQITAAIILSTTCSNQVATISRTTPPLRSITKTLTAAAYTIPGLVTRVGQTNSPSTARQISVPPGYGSIAPYGSITQTSPTPTSTSLYSFQPTSPTDTCYETQGGVYSDVNIASGCGATPLLATFTGTAKDTTGCCDERATITSLAAWVPTKGKGKYDSNAAAKSENEGAAQTRRVALCDGRGPGQCGGGSVAGVGDSVWLLLLLIWGVSFAVVVVGDIWDG